MELIPLNCKKGQAVRSQSKDIITNLQENAIN